MNDAPKKAPKWEVDARERMRSTLRHMLKPVADLVARDANEGDTRLFVTDVLCDVLGYDKYSDLTTEYRVKGEFADYGIRIDQQLSAFVEVKRCTTKLNQRHLRQVEMYRRTNGGVEWTNSSTKWPAVAGLQAHRRTAGHDRPGSRHRSPGGGDDTGEGCCSPVPSRA